MTDLDNVQRAIETSLRAWTMWWLCNMPAASANDLVRVGPHTYKQINRELGTMRRAKLAFAVRVGWRRRPQYRWALTRDGVKQASDTFFGGDIPWPTTEEGLKRILEELPVWEILYEVAPVLLRDWLEHSGQIPYPTPDPGMSGMQAGLLLTEGDVSLRSLQLQWTGFPQAVATYGRGGQLPFVCVDRHADSRTLAGLAKIRFLDRRVRNAAPGDDSNRPACSAIVCEGAVAEALALRHLWPDETRIFVRLTGSKTSVKFPSEPKKLSSSLPLNPDGPTALGRPERVFDWVNHEPSMLMYRDPMAGKLVALAEQYRCVRPTDAAEVWKVSGRIVKPAAEELVKQGLLNRSPSGLSLAEPGGLGVARRSVANFRIVLSRYGLLDHDGDKPTKNERRHRRQFARMGMTWRSHELHLELGDRLGFDTVTGREAFPNGWVKVDGPEGNGVLHAVELDGPRPRLDGLSTRIEPYLAAQKAGQPQPLLLIFQTRAREDQLLRQHPYLWALTTTVAEAIKGSHSGKASIWRYQGRGCDIGHLLTVAPEEGTLAARIRFGVNRWFGGNRR